MSIKPEGFGTKRKGTPKKTTKEKIESKEKLGVSDRYPIYFVRILEILRERKSFEKDFFENPGYWNSKDVDFSDYKFEGYRQEDLNIQLSSRTSNSKIRTLDYRDLLEIMNDPTASYINRYTDENGSDRYRITLLGESFLQFFEENKSLAGFWNLIKKTQIPKTKGRIFEIPKRF